MHSSPNEIMLRSLIILAITLPLSAAAEDASPFPFDRTQLSGWWGESVNTAPACGFQNLKTAMEISQDGKRLAIRYDRKWSTALGTHDGASASIVAATSRTLTIRYDDETRRKASGKPVEWELSMVAPGVYRWRETDSPAGEVNIVVGIRCMP
jgi:hypothetical protein